MMKQYGIRFAAVAALAVAIAPAAFAQAVGTWAVEIDTGDALIESLIVIDEEMNGVLVNDEGEIPLEGVEFEEGVLVFTATVPYGGEELDIEFEGDIDGDEIEGYLYTDLGEAAVFGERVVVITAVGTWDIEIDAGGTIIEDQLIFESDSKGKMITADGEYDMSKVELDGDELIFVVEIDFNEEKLEVEFEGTIEGNALEGYVYTAIGEAAVEGKRQAGGVLVGTWACEVDTGDAIIESQLIFESDTKGKQVIDGNEIELQALKVEDGEVYFELTVPYQGENLDIEFEGEVDGDELEGYIYTALGEAQLFATRQ